jgi:hypothetical protein
MKKTAAIFASVTFLLICAFVAESQAELYQYIDKNGVLVITDKKPESKSKVTTFKDTSRKTEGQTEREAGPEVKAKGPEGAPPQAAEGQAQPRADKPSPADLQKKRNQEAARLEAEANKSAPFSPERQREQYEMLRKAERLRRGIDDP